MKRIMESLHEFYKEDPALALLGLVVTFVFFPLALLMAYL